MDRVWDTSKYDPKLLMSIFKVKVIQGHEERSNKKYVWNACYMFLHPYFVKNAKHDPLALLER